MGAFLLGTSGNSVAKGNHKGGHAMRMRNVLLVFVILVLICGTGCKSYAWAQQSAPRASDTTPM
jgi:hypothetical protein